MDAALGLLMGLILFALLGAAGFLLLCAMAVVIKGVLIGSWYILRGLVWIVVQTLMLPVRLAAFIVCPGGSCGTPAIANRPRGLCDNGACCCVNPPEARYCRRCGHRLHEVRPAVLQAA